MKNFYSLKLSTLFILFFGLTGVLFAQPLSGGTYTIDPALPTGGTNFQKFNEVATRLNADGVIGSVVFEVKEGIYYDSLVLVDIPGSSVLNTVKFKSAPTNTNPVVLSSTSSTITTGTIQMNATKYVSFDGLTLENTSTGTYARLVIVAGTLANIQFKNCIFNGALSPPASTTKSIFYGGTNTAFIGTGLLIDSCKTYNGSAVFYFTGSTTARSSNVTITNNEFNDYNYYAMYTSYIDNLKVSKNKFRSNIVTNTTYTIYTFNATSSPGTRAEVTMNDIKINATSTMYGIYLSYFNALSTQPSLVANNFFLNTSLNSSSTRYSLYLTANNNIDILHNTFKINDGSATTSRLLYITSATPTGYTPGNHRIHNNIFVNNATSTSATAGPLVYATATAWAYVTSISNNVWMAPNAAFPFYNGTSYADFNSWATAVGETNSYYGDPQFVSATDLHVEGILASDKGLNFASVTNDIDGETRPLAPSVNVDIGADEFPVPTCAKPANINLVSADTNNITVSWLSGPMATSWIVEYGLNGFTPGTGTIISTSTNPTTISGLTKDRFYDIYVYSVCGTDTSDHFGPFEGNTYNQGIYFEYENECMNGGFYDIAPTGTQNAMLSDGKAGFQLPFPILLQGQKISEITISNNGVILFNTINGTVSSANGNTIASSALPGLYPFWDDLDDAGGMVYWQVVGVAPNRKFIIQWNKKHDLYQAGTPFILQAVLDEKTNDIYYQYNNSVTGSATYDYGRSATIGLVGSSVRTPISYNNESFLQSNSCLRFFHTNCSKIQNLIIDYLQADNVQFSWLAGQSGANGYTIKYGPAGFDPTTGGVTLTTTDLFIIIPGLTEKTTYDVYVYADCSASSQSGGTKSSFTTPPYCSNPDGIAVTTKIDSLLSTWNWTANPNYDITAFEIMYGWRNFDTSSVGASFVMVDTNFSDTTYNSSFVAGGVYDYYLRAICGVNRSEFIGPFSFRMPLTNDDVCNAELIQVDGKILHLDNTGATVQTGESTIAPPATGAKRTDGWANSDLASTTWFKFIAPPGGQIRINCTARTYNGQIAVYSGNCTDFSTMVFLAANDDDITGTSLAPNFTVCGLVPGNEYLLMHDGFTTAKGIYALSVSEVVLNAGSTNGLYNACEGELVNLYSLISNYTQGGNWSELSNTFVLQNDSIFKTAGLLPNTYQFGYELTEGCAMDSVITAVKIFPKNNAGTGQTVNICKNQYFNLYQGLNGTVDHGGIWKDANGQVIQDGIIKTGQISIPGTYTFTYEVSNGVCPSATSSVQVTVQSICNALSIVENEFAFLSVYPNPTSGNIYINTEVANLAQVKVVLTDVNGRVVLDEVQLKKNIENKQIDLSSLEDGIYMLQLSSPDSSKTIRILKNSNK